MNKNKSAIIVAVIVIVVLFVLFAWPRFADSTREIAGKWNAAGIDCLPAHTNANQHIHQLLRITVDGKLEVIPANTGIVKSCMAEIHTHDLTGTIHVESVESGKVFHLQDFFTVWGKTIERPGYALEIQVDGVSITELDSLVLKDGQKIDLEYKKVVTP